MFSTRRPARLLSLCLTIFLFGAAAAQASEWTLVKEESAVTFEATQGSTPFTGRFENFTADITLDPENLETASIRAEIDTASVKTGAGDRDGALPGSQWFNSSNFPMAVFQSQKVRHLEGNKYVAEGTLTLKGIANPLALPFTLDIDGNTAHAKGSTGIDRLAFKVGEGEMAAPGIAGLHVTVHVDVTATR